MTEIKKYQMYINNEFVEAEDGKRFDSLNPENNQPWASFPEANKNDVNKAVQGAKDAFGGWSKLKVTERAQYLRAIGDLLKENAELLGRTETIDSGKLLKETKFATEYVREYFHFYADLAEKMEVLSHIFSRKFCLF
jgi:aldehyde dehydrogenase (NAD+)/betaine-aldehyde dehydrogenase